MAAQEHSTSSFKTEFQPKSTGKAVSSFRGRPLLISLTGTLTWVDINLCRFREAFVAPRPPLPQAASFFRMGSETPWLAAT